MYITVPLRKKKNLKVQKKHQELIFKEIQYNTIFEQINLQEELNKSNGFKALKNKFITDHQEKSQEKSALTKSQITLKRRGIITSEHSRCHRPSVLSFFSNNSKDKKNHQLLKTTGDFFDRKNIYEDKHKFEEKAQKMGKEEKKRHIQNTFLKNTKKKMLSQEIYENLIDERSKKKVKQKRKSVTLLDLKVKNIQRIIKNSGQSQVEDFVTSAEKDQKTVAKSCWNMFLCEMIKNCKKAAHVQEKIKTLRRTAATTHRQRKVFEPENLVQALFVQKNKIGKVQMSDCITPRKKSFDEGEVSNHKKHCPLESEKIWDFFNFVKGVQKDDEYSCKMSLVNYQKSIPKFYILRNSEEAIKESLEYRKITTENFKNYKPEQIISFIYLKENQYKLKSKKNEFQMKQVVP